LDQQPDASHGDAEQRFARREWAKSIAVSSSPYGGFQVLRWGTALDTTLCKSLTFRIHGGAKGGQNLRVAMMNGAAEGRRWQIVPVPEAKTVTASSNHRPPNETNNWNITKLTDGTRVNTRIGHRGWSERAPRHQRSH